MLFTMFQDLLTVIQVFAIFDSIWAPLATTLTTEFMYLLWKSIGLLVFVTWHDKVVCRRQQRQQQEILQFVFAFFSRSAFFIFRILPYVPQYFSASRIPHFTRSRFSAFRNPHSAFYRCPYQTPVPRKHATAHNGSTAPLSVVTVVVPLYTG